MFNIHSKLNIKDVSFNEIKVTSLDSRLLDNALDAIERASELSNGTLREKYDKEQYRLTFVQIAPASSIVTFKDDEQELKMNHSEISDIHLIIEMPSENFITNRIAHYSSNRHQTKIFKWIEDNLPNDVIQYDYTLTPSYVPFSLLKYLYTKRLTYEASQHTIKVSTHQSYNLLNDGIAISYLSTILEKYFAKKQFSLTNDRVFTMYTTIAEGIFNMVIGQNRKLVQERLGQDEYSVDQRRKRKRSQGIRLRKQFTKRAKRERQSGMDIEFCGVFTVAPPNKSWLKLSNIINNSTLISGDEKSCNPYTGGCVFYSWHSHPYSISNFHRVLVNPISEQDMNVYISMNFTVNEIYTIAGIYRTTFNPLLLNLMSNDAIRTAYLPKVTSYAKQILETIISTKDYTRDNLTSIILLIIIMLYLSGGKMSYKSNYSWFRNYPFFVTFDIEDKPLSKVEGINIGSQSLTVDVSPLEQLTFDTQDTFGNIVKILESNSKSIDISFITKKWMDLIYAYNNEYVERMNNIFLQDIFDNVQDTIFDGLQDTRLINISFHPIDYIEMYLSPADFEIDYSLFLSRVQLNICGWNK